MRVGLYSPYLGTLGGGERYIFSVAEYFLKKGDRVDIFSDEKINRERIADRFALDIKGATFVKDIFSANLNLFQKLQNSSLYDLIFFLSDGSIPTSLAKANILHFQTPFKMENQKNLINRIKLSRFQLIVCNSYFTKKFVDETYGVESKVLNPPVDTTKFISSKKENLILSVGRFFAPSPPKKQEVMIESFKKLQNRGLSGWKLVLFGACEADSLSRLKRLKTKIKTYPIEIKADGSFSVLQKLYTKARIYWHAAGCREDLERRPERAEHFGISIVEAMASGCIPIVFFGGGPKEIIQQGKNGLFWRNEDELIHNTELVSTDEKLQRKIAKGAIARARFFSKERFFEELGTILS